MDESCPKCKIGVIVELTKRIRHCSNPNCGLVLEDDNKGKEGQQNHNN